MRDHKAIQSHPTRKTPRVSRAFFYLLKLIVPPVFRRRYNIHFHNTQAVRNLKPPYLVLASHRSHLDPFFLSLRIPHPIQYVVADAVFRSKFVRFVLTRAGAIPKRKAMSDFDTVRLIMGVKSAGGVIGIFPEGQNSWDGTPLPIYYSTAKLIRFLKIPVITAVPKGAFFTRPRWARGDRTGRVVVEYDRLFDGPDLRRMTVEEIYRRVRERLSHDEQDYQDQAQVSFRSSRRAEYLEQALFACPSCGEIGSLRSHRNDLHCQACGYRVFFSRKGYFAEKHGRSRLPRVTPRSIKEWNGWQVDWFTRRIAAYGASGDPEPLLSDRRVLVERGARSKPLERFHFGTLSLYRDRLVIHPLIAARAATFHLARIDGLNVQERERIEFYYDRKLYRFAFMDRHVSAYKWLLAVRTLLGLPLYPADRDVAYTPAPSGNTRS